MVSLFWAQLNLIMTHVWVFVLNHKPYHIPLKYRCPIKNSDHIRHTYLTRPPTSMEDLEVPKTQFANCISSRFFILNNKLFSPDIWHLTPSVSFIKEGDLLQVSVLYCSPASHFHCIFNLVMIKIQPKRNVCNFLTLLFSELPHCYKYGNWTKQELIWVRTLQASRDHLGPLHTQAKSHVHEVVRAQKKASEGHPHRSIHVSM